MAVSVQSQDTVRFVNNTPLLEEQNIGGPLCRAFVDLNGDYRDDIIRLKNNNILYYDISSDNASYFKSYRIAKLPSDAWTISAADLNNDGITEIITAGAFNPLSLWSANNAPLKYDSIQIESENFLAQASNIVDINNDGWLDVFVCNDIGLSKVYINDGTGQLIEDPGLIDMVTVLPSDNSGNYGSEWTDVDGDGDLDLYIAKCKINVYDFDDPRRVNALFINEDGIFREAAEDFGIAVGAQSWTANFGDIDNDSDMDLFISNHGFRSMLFENIDNDTFIEIDLLASGEELISGIFQSALYDFNNDGFLDILLGGEEDFLLLNTGDKSFTSIDTPFGIEDVWSFAISDADLDGFADLITTRNTLAVVGQYRTDSLYMSVPNSNNYLGIALQGIQSNRSAVGARVDIHGAWGTQSRIIKAGTGYGITNSLKANFGLGQNASIDSLKIYWPSGIEDSYYDLGVNNYYLAIEGNCLEEFVHISASDDFIDCANSSVELISKDGIDLTWPSGNQGNSEFITEEGFYSSYHLNTPGCVVPSQSIWIEALDPPVQPILDLRTNASICKDDLIEIRVLNFDSTEWSTGNHSERISIQDEGSYYAYNFNYCDTLYSDTIELQYLQTYFQELNEDLVLDSVQSLQLGVDRNAIRWYSDSLRINLITEEDILEIPQLDSDSCFYFDFELEAEPLLYSIGERLSIIDTIESRDLGFNEGIRFKVFDSLRVKTVQCYSFKEGPRRIQLKDESSSLIFEKEIFIQKGLNILDLNFSIAEGSYILTTDAAFNLQVFDSVSPSLAIVEFGTSYPYQITDVISLEGPNLVFPFYPYFFEWDIEHYPETCRSDIHSYCIDIDTISSSNTLDISDFKIYPVPADNEIHISSPVSIDEFQILNSNGQLVVKRNVSKSEFSVDLQSIDASIYILRLKTRNNIHSFKLLKH